MKNVLITFSLLAFLITSAQAQRWRPESPDQRLAPEQFQQQIRAFDDFHSGPERLRHSHGLASRHWLTSRQVKEIALRLPEEGERFEFARAAYARTIDKENFYDVYDVFSRFSVALRLHDAIHLQPVPAMPPVPVVVGADQFEEMKKTIRNQPFDETRKSIAKQILEGRPRFTARQIREVVRLFDFENSRLEIAKFGFDATVDPENYFLVTEAFDFDSSKASLMTYIRTKTRNEQPVERK